ncbi:MAG TPA: ABC transporter permease [Saprospiraceae bacterium]|nr:ABC transporter permease [Saprospiraceae bacterium]
MSLLQLAWKNLVNKPLAMMLSLVLFALGTGLIALLLLMQKQLQENFEKNLAGIDLVIGAKGSPLQLILSSMYHIDSPTGNISLKEARPFLNPTHPLIETAVPLSLGDSYGGYHIAGTTHEFLKLYRPQLSAGKLWEANMEVTIGATVAKAMELKIGDKFKSSHGFEEDVDVGHVDHLSFTVVGIFAPQGTVVDHLILTTNQSFWLVHGEVDHAHETDTTHESLTQHDHEAPLHSDSDTKSDDDSLEKEEHIQEGNSAALTDKSIPFSLLEEDESLDITSLLIKFKAHNYQALNMPRNINENTDMLAADPAMEINRLFSLMSTGERILTVLAWVITIVSGLSVFISLFSSLRDRRYELALMRVMGGGRSTLFLLIILEGLLLSGIGCLIGIALSHGAMQMLGSAMEESYRYNFTGMRFLKEEIWLIVGALVIGFIAAVIPAVQASRTDIAKTLTEG